MDRDYIAFISYRHTKVDIEVATELQKLIEHYIIPKNLRKNDEKRLGYIFRDKEELKVSSDLSDSLREALDNSEYLIAICSPEYKESEWGAKEISYFLQNHDVDHVLPVLVSGTTREAFPDELIRKSVVDGEEVLLEPLAADVVANDSKTRKQLIKKEYLRIIAQLLGCNYDELVQRQKKYQRKRAMIAGGIAGAFVLGFIGMLLVKNHQINEKYQESLRNQARFASQQSLDLMEIGDSEGAIETAVSVKPSDGSDGPVVPEQMYALLTAMNAYRSGPYPAKLNVPNYSEIAVSDDMKYSYLKDSNTQGRKKVYIYDNQSREIVWTVSEVSLRKEFKAVEKVFADKDYYDEMIDCLIPNGDTGLIIVVDDVGINLDVKNKACISCFEVDAYDIAQSSDIHDGIFAFGDYKGILQIYDLSSGKMIAEKDFNAELEKTKTEYEINAVKFTEDGKKLAIGLSYDHLTDDEVKNGAEFRLDWQERKDDFLQDEPYFRANPPMGLITYDWENDSIDVFSSQETGELTVADGYLGAYHEQMPVFDVEATYIIADNIMTYQSCLYRLEDKSLVYSSEKKTNMTGGEFNIEAGELEGRNVVICGIMNDLAVIDAETGSVISMLSFKSDVINTFINHNHIYIVLESGKIEGAYISNGSAFTETYINLNSPISAAWMDKDRNFLVDAQTGLIYCTWSSWQGYQWTSTSCRDLQDYKTESIEYATVSDKEYRIVTYYDTNSFEDIGIEVYLANSDDAVYQYACKNKTDIINNIFIGGTDENSYLCYQVVSESGDSIVKKIDLSTGKVCYKKAFSDSDKIHYSAEYQKYVYTSDCEKVFIEFDYNVIRCIPLSDKDADNQVWSIERPEYIDDIYLTGDDNFLLWKENSEDSLSQGGYVYCCDLETKEVFAVSEPDNIPDLYHLELGCGDSSSLCWMEDGDGILYVYDCQSRNMVGTVDFARGISVAFFRDDRYLLVSEDAAICMYDLTTLEQVSRMTKEENEFGLNEGILATGKNDDFFLLSSSGYLTSRTDDGYVPQNSCIYYVDENYQIYPFADIPGENIYISLSAQEISKTVNNEFGYDSFEYGRFFNDWDNSTARG